MILWSIAQVLLSRSLLLQLAGADITAANRVTGGQDNTGLDTSLWWHLITHNIVKLNRQNKVVLISLINLMMSNEHLVLC